VVSCHVSEDNVNDTSPDIINDADHSDINTDIKTDQPEVDRQVSFNATVMAVVIAEATNDNEDQFIGASFA
jgi:hypothetical protein